MIILIGAEKQTFDKIQCPFMIKYTQETGREFPQLDKGHLQKPLSYHNTKW